MSEHLWLATVVYLDGIHEQRRCTTRDEAEAWRDVRLSQAVNSHSVVRTSQDENARF